MLRLRSDLRNGSVGNSYTLLNPDRENLLPPFVNPSSCDHAYSLYEGGRISVALLNTSEYLIRSAQHILNKIRLHVSATNYQLFSGRNCQNAERGDFTSVFQCSDLLLSEWKYMYYVKYSL